MHTAQTNTTYSTIYTKQKNAHKCIRRPTNCPTKLERMIWAGIAERGKRLTFSIGSTPVLYLLPVKVKCVHARNDNRTLRIWFDKKKDSLHLQSLYLFRSFRGKKYGYAPVGLKRKTKKIPPNIAQMQCTHDRKLSRNRTIGARVYENTFALGCQTQCDDGCSHLKETRPRHYFYDVVISVFWLYLNTFKVPTMDLRHTRALTRLFPMQLIVNSLLLLLCRRFMTMP